EEYFDALISTLAPVFFPEPQQEHGALSIGETLQIFTALRVVITLQQLDAVGRLVSAVAHQIAHQAYERQVDRLLQGFAHGGQTAVVLTPEVAEVVHAGAGKEALAGA